MSRLACVAALTCFATRADADPFLVRNQNPLLVLYGLPSPVPARLSTTGSGRIATVVNWSNAAATKAAGDKTYTVDGESVELRLHAEWGLGERFAVRTELAWRRLSEGSLDGFIEGWHGIFGLPDGSRNQLPRDQLLIEYREGTTTRLQVDRGVSGVCDIPIAIGYQAYATERRAVAAWLTVKSPVGSVEDLSGSGAVDVALTLAAESQLRDRWQIFGQSSVAWLGEGDLLGDLQEDYAWTALAGITWNAWRGLDLTAQLAANSRIFDSGDTGLDGDAVVLTFGGTYRMAGGWQFDFGISEDVEVSASPDVAFNFAARHGF